MNSKNIWTITPVSDNVLTAFHIYSNGGVDLNGGVAGSDSVIPVVYLNSNVKTINGNGSEENPYILS